MSQKQKFENLESEPEGSKKQKKDYHYGSPAKRVRPLNQEISRVKEFLAGNVTTSFARTTFLWILYKILKFHEMVVMVPTLVCIQLFRTIVDFFFFFFIFQPKASPIPDDFPSWASWKSQDVFLPASFHNSSAFNKNLSIAKKSFQDNNFEPGKIDTTISKMWEPIYVFIMEYKRTKFYILLIRS